MNVTAHDYEVRPQAGPNGFTWVVYALTYPQTKSGSRGETYGLGTPRSERVASHTFRSIAEAQCNHLRRALSTQVIR